MVIWKNGKVTGVVSNGNGPKSSSSGEFWTSRDLFRKEVRSIYFLVIFKEVESSQSTIFVFPRVSVHPGKDRKISVVSRRIRFYQIVSIVSRLYQRKIPFAKASRSQPGDLSFRASLETLEFVQMYGR